MNIERRMLEIYDESGLDPLDEDDRATARAWAHEDALWQAVARNLRFFYGVTDDEAIERATVAVAVVGRAARDEVSE